MSTQGASASCSTTCSPNLKLQEIHGQIGQIEDTDRVESLQVAGTFAGIEDHLFRALLIAMKMGVAVQRQIMVITEMLIKIQWIVDNHN